jgi:hypothetical protein
MVAHPKQKRRETFPSQYKLPHKIAASLLGPAQEVVNSIRKILKDPKNLNEQEKFLLIHVLKAADRLRAPPETKEELGKELEDHAAEGEKLGISPEKISGMNAAVFLLDNQGDLDQFIRQAKNILN